MKEEYIKWHSPNLSKDIEMLVFGHYGLPLIIFPTTKGKYYESKDFKLIEAASEFLEAGKVKIYCPDSADEYSWYNRGVSPADRVKNHIWYDKMVLEEIVGKIQHDFQIAKVGVAGCSFGGFHACNFAFRHPDKVSHFISMSGSFDIKDQLDGYYDENVYFNNPVDFISDVQDPNLWKMKIILGTCEYDICKDANYYMSELLNRKGVNHWLDDRPGSHHDWTVWREMFPHYLSQI